MGWVAGLLAMPALVRCPRPALVNQNMEQNKRWLPRTMTLVLIAYTLYGAGYIAYATFIIAYLKELLAFTPAEISLFWTLLGTAAVAAAFVWGPLLSRLRGGYGTAVTIAMLAAGAALPLLWISRPPAYLSAILFGGSFLSVVTAVTTFARRVAPAHQWTTAIGTLTAAFGIGQCAGPVLSGAFSDGPDGVRSGLWLSVGILIAAAAVASLQQELEEASNN